MTWQENLYNAHQAKRDAKAAPAKKRAGSTGKINQPDREANETERLFEDHYLKPMLIAGEISKYRFESIRLRLANGHSYRPEWSAVNASGRLVFWEVKAGLRRQREAGISQIKVAADKYPEFEFYYCLWTGADWKITKVMP